MPCVSHVAFILYIDAHTICVRAQPLFICLFYFLGPRARTPVYFYFIALVLFAYIIIVVTFQGTLVLSEAGPLYYLVGYYLLAHNLIFI